MRRFRAYGRQPMLTTSLRSTKLWIQRLRWRRRLSRHPSASVLRCVSYFYTYHTCPHASPYHHFISIYRFFPKQNDIKEDLSQMAVYNFKEYTTIQHKLVMQQKVRECETNDKTHNENNKRLNKLHITGTGAGRGQGEDSAGAKGGDGT